MDLSSLWAGSLAEGFGEALKFRASFLIILLAVCCYWYFRESQNSRVLVAQHEFIPDG